MSADANNIHGELIQGGEVFACQYLLHASHHEHSLLNDSQAPDVIRQIVEQMTHMLSIATR